MTARLDNTDRGRRLVNAKRHCSTMPYNRLLAAVAGGLCGLVADIANAPAASVGCGSAVNPLERAVCADPVLAALSSNVTSLYATALARLSPVGQDLLRTSQSRWLAYLDDACMQTDRPVEDDMRGWCLSDGYRSRLNDLSLSVVSDGHFLFQRVDNYFVSYNVTINQNYLPLAKHHIANIRIDRPVNDMTAAWNSRTLRNDDDRGQCDGEDGDTLLEASVDYANETVISLLRTDFNYCHGTPHGFGTTSTDTLILQSPLRPMQAGDLFQVAGDWRSRLKTLGMSRVRAVAKTQHVEADEDRFAGRVADAMTDVGHWRFSHAGLTIAFNLYELGEGRNFAPEIQIPWTDLSDVLVSHPPVP